MTIRLNLLKKLNISSKTPLILSVSGGVDSIVLLDLLIKENYNVVVVHFNHHTRDENILEQNLVEEITKKHNLKLYVFDFNYTIDNFQNEARNFRHEKLELVANLHKTKYILTAHHLDDLAETVLMKLTRGSNLYGYSGINEILNKNEFIYLKPLLYISKEDILNYSNNYNLKYLTDSSNYETKYLRNRYRHTIIPIMKQENPNLLNQIKDYNKLLYNTFNFVRKYSKKFIKNNKININLLLKEEDVIINEVISIILDNKDITYNKNLINDLKSLLINDKPNLTYKLNNNYIFIKSYNEAYISLNKEKTYFKVLLTKDINELPNMKKITFLKSNSNKTKNTNKLCYNEIRLPLIARLRENGDLLHFNYGKKKLKDFLIDKKIPKLKRDQLLIITDSNNLILWVENLYINETLGNKNEIYFKIGDL